MSVLERVARAVDGEGLSMVVQPIVDLDTGVTAGYEALARFSGTPPRSALDWFRDAGDVGLRTELELAAVREAVGLVDRLPDRTYLSVNVSPETVLAEGRLADAMLPAPRGRVALELTEHVRVADYDALLAALGDMRAGGVRLIVDDAGAGFASFRHILRLSPDAMKLDRGLVAGIHADRARRALTRAIVAFALEVDVTVIAEGVESHDEWRILCDLGVHQGQGFYLGRPTPLR